VKTAETDGYSAIQVTAGSKKANRVTKAEAGHFAKAGVAAGNTLCEFRLDNGESAPDVGAEITVAHVEAGQLVDVSGVSRGKGLDNSAFQMIDVTEMPYKQVCVFRDNMTTPADYASIIHTMAKTYNDASVLVEINDIGGQVADTLHFEFEYENIMYTENNGRSGKRISAGFKNRVDRGIRTTKPVKSIGCSMLKLLIEQNQLIINDHGTIAELNTFSKKHNSYEAESGNHDDLVMCLVLFAWLSDQNYFRHIVDINTLMKLRDKSEDELLEELTPFGFMDDGFDDSVSVDSNGDLWLNA
jgi:hypothetical protein